MKFLHTADWHLGRTLSEYSLLPDQQHRLSQLIDAAREEQVDAVVIAGDLYDRSVPPAQAVSLLDETLFTLTQVLAIPVLAIAGNHDSPQRLAFGNRLYAASGLYVEAEPAKELRRVALADSIGPVDFYLLPFFTPELVRPWFPERNIRTYNDAFLALMEHNLPQLDPKRRNVLIAHGFYRKIGEQALGDDAIFSESEIAIGGNDLIDLGPAAVFDYVALGHLHAPQRAGGDNARYSGSLLKYSVSEARQRKGFLLVELGKKGECSQTLLSPPPLHELRTVQGTLEQLLTANTPSQDYVLATLTDQGAVLGAMERLRGIFPNILGLRFATRELDSQSGTLLSRTKELLEQQGSLSPLELFSNFYRQVRQEPLSPERQALVESAIQELENDRESAAGIEKEEAL